MGKGCMLSKLLFLLLALMFITQSCAYLTVKFNITNKNTGKTKTFTYYVDLSYLNNPKTYENEYVKIELLLKNYTVDSNTYYNLTWNITAKVNLSYTAELFNSSGEHPGWVGGNPYTCNNLPNGWWDSSYWQPIKPEEIGPEYRPPTTKSPIPLGAVILTLIAIPLLVLLRRVK